MHLLIFLDLKHLGLGDRNVVLVVMGRLALVLSLLLRLSLLLLHTVKQVELSVCFGLFCHPRRASKPVADVLVLDILLRQVLWVLNRLAGWVDCEIVACRKVLKAVLD